MFFKFIVNGLVKVSGSEVIYDGGNLLSIKGSVGLVFGLLVGLVCHRQLVLIYPLKFKYTKFFKL